MPSVKEVHPGYWGAWGAEVFSNQRVVGLQVRLEGPQDGGGDDTSLNGIRIKSREFDNTNETDRLVESGIWGEWGPWVTIPDSHYICGLEVRMEDPQGAGNDDTAMNGLRMFHCPKGGDPTNDAVMTEVTAGNWGEWKGRVMVDRDHYLAGLQTRFEPYVPGADGDDTALNGLQMFTFPLPADWKSSADLHFRSKLLRKFAGKVKPVKG